MVLEPGPARSCPHPLLPVQQAWKIIHHSALLAWRGAWEAEKNTNQETLSNERLWDRAPKVPRLCFPSPLPGQRKFRAGSRQSWSQQQTRLCIDIPCTHSLTPSSLGEGEMSFPVA